MARNVWGIVTGLLVLALGVVAVAGLLHPGDTAAVTATVPSPVPVVASTEASPPQSVAPELPGVPSRISKVLEWNGDAVFAGDDELAQLPPSVAAVLTQYGVPLRIPITKGQG